MPIYMQFEGIKGDVTVPGYIGWIELSSAQLGQTRNITSATGRGTNREAARPSVSEIVVTKLQDASSAGLFRESAVGQGKKVTIAFVKSGGPGEAAYLKIELENALISSYSVSGHGGSTNDRPMESLSINFTKITYVQGGQAQLQNAQQGWDLATAKGG